MGQSMGYVLSKWSQRRSGRSAAVAAVALALLGSAFVADARADGNPDLALSKQAPATVLYGETSPVTLTASNPTGPTGYNLSFNDVLPVGISYVPGSSDAIAGEPQVIDNAPGPGQTTLIWSNLADLTAASQFSFGYRVAHSPTIFGVGSSYTNNAGAYVNCNPRFVPDFDATGQAVQSGGDLDCDDTNPEESYTGSATASAETDISAIEIVKSEPSPEDELLRGIHDHQTTYTLEVTNNDVAATNGVDVEDYLPAGLEFLGCGGADNTTDAPTNPGSTEEYPGSGPINPGNEPGGGSPPGCVAPDLVETVADPPGLPGGVYTHVVWSNVADLAPGGTRTLRYLAAIPIRENTLDWNGADPGSGTAPDPASGLQASNLDNNSGAETNEDGNSEPSLTNRATATGNFDDGVTPGGVPVSDSDEKSVTAEDLRVLKSVSSGALSPGATSTWSLQVDTSEYRYVNSIEVTDTLGDGYCPLGATNLEQTPPAADPECDPTGAMPSSPYASTQENPDGTWTIEWDETSDPALGRMLPSTSHTITFPTKTRAFYQENFTDSTPVLAEDAAENHVDIRGIDFVRCAPGAVDGCTPGGPDEISHDEPSGTPDTDESEAGQVAPGASVDKKVDSAPNTADCLTGTYVDGPPTSVAPGDHLCFRVRMDFPGTPQTGSVTVSDFIPPGTTYDAGSAQATAVNTVGFATGSTTAEPDTDGSQLTWPLDDSGGTVTAGQVFEVVFSVTVLRQAAAGDGDISDNLEKAVFSNTEGESFPLRDSAALELSQPELTLLKGVRDVDGAPPAGNGPNVDGVQARPGSAVTYRLDVSNAGSLAATSSEIWDILPAQTSCADIAPGSISNGGVCNPAPDRIEWNGVAVGAGATTTLTYDLIVPGGLAPTDVLDNTAGVRSYESSGGGGTFVSVPSHNIDPTQEPAANAGPADDPSSVLVQGVAMTKTRTTEVNQAGNNLASQATIGERIDYTVTGTVFAGTTLFGPDVAIADNVGTRQTLVPGSVAATLDDDGAGGAAPVPLPTAGLTVSIIGTTVSVDFPEPYANPLGSGDDIIALTFSTTVDDDYPANQGRGTAAQNTLPNTGTLSFLDSNGDPKSSSASTSTRLVEPDVATVKSNDAGPTVAPGDIVTYTVGASNGGPATGTSVANEVSLVDTLPLGLTPVNLGVPVPNGGSVDPDGGIWDQGARTITWTHPSLAPGANTSRTYDALIDNDAVGAGTLVNTVRATTTSMPGTVTGERTAASAGPSPGVPPGGYLATASSSVSLTAGNLIKVSDPNDRTVGDVVTHTVTVTIPPLIQQFDAVVVDDLPDGLAFDSYSSAICTAGCSPGPTDISPATLTPIPNGDGTRLGWSLGDIAAAPNARTVALVYRTHVEDTYAGGAQVVDGETLQNEAILAFNTTDEVGAPPTSPPDPADYDQQRSATADTEIVEPELALDKDVSGDPDDDDARTAVPGDSFTYTLRVTNNGTAPAYDVAVADQPDPALTNVVPTTGAGFVTEPWTAGDPAMRWVIPGPIQPNETVLLEYTADLVPSASLSDDQQVVNTADVPSYFGVPAAERTANGFDYRDYDNVPPDTVTITVEVPALEIVKTTDAAGFPDDAPAAIETPFGWRVVVTNPNPGSRLFGVDVSDVLPANWSYVPGSAQVSGTGDLTPGGQVNPQVSNPAGGQRLSWSNLADLDGGETVIVDFDAEPSPLAAVDPGTGAANPNLNDASASGSDSSGAGGSANGPYADSDGASATLAVPSIDLAVTKKASRPTPPAGTAFDWTVTVTNNGPDTAPDVTMTDDLPAGTSFVSATTKRGSCSRAGSVVTCKLGTIASGQSITIVIRSMIDRSVEGQTLTNDAIVADLAGADTDPTNNDAEAAVAAAPFIEGISEACTGGQLGLTPSQLWAGVPKPVTAVVTDPAGKPVQFAPVSMQLASGNGTVSPATVETDAQGRAVFTLEGMVGTTWTASVGACKLAASASVQSAKSCRGLDVSPRSLTAGKSGRLRLRLRAPDGEPIRGVSVKARGAGAVARARTKDSGRAVLRVRPKRSGVVRVTAREATKCVVRVGVAAGATGSQLTG
jgi:uncharacterized repeat protein (TIGR01451 family)/fimbrial isopeptide formation D2 family protein